MHDRIKTPAAVHNLTEEKFPKETIKMKTNAFKKIKASAAAGLAAAVILGSFSESLPQTYEETPQSFLFPQFSSSAAAEKDGKSDGDITFSFKISELIGRLIRKF